MVVVDKSHQPPYTFCRGQPLCQSAHLLANPIFLFHGSVFPSVWCLIRVSRKLDISAWQRSSLPPRVFRWSNNPFAVYLWINKVDDTLFKGDSTPILYAWVFPVPGSHRQRVNKLHVSLCRWRTANTQSGPIRQDVTVSALMRRNSGCVLMAPANRSEPWLYWICYWIPQKIDISHFLDDIEQLRGKKRQDY
jgi:hypothetical protein